MLLDHLAEIHPVELVAREDEEVVMRVRAEVHEVAAHGVRRALIPTGALFGLLGRHDVDESLAERIEVVGALHVAVQGRRVELREQKNAIDARVEAVADRDVDQAVLARQRHRRFAALLGQRIKARALSAAHDDGEHAGIDVHGSEEWRERPAMRPAGPGLAKNRQPRDSGCHAGLYWPGPRRVDALSGTQ